MGGFDVPAQLHPFPPGVGAAWGLPLDDLELPPDLDGVAVAVPGDADRLAAGVDAEDVGPAGGETLEDCLVVEGGPATP